MGKRVDFCHFWDSSTRRAIEWTFFSDDGPWSSSKNSFHRKARCSSCNKTVRSKRETMGNHIKNCSHLPSGARLRYVNSSDSFKASTTRGISSGDTQSIKNFFQPKLTADASRKIENQLLRAFIATNTSFNAASSSEFQKLFNMLNSSFITPRRTKLSTTVFDRVSNQERQAVISLYGNRSFVSLCVDGWKTPTSKKWLGFCALLRGYGNENVAIDVRRFEDVTGRGETEPVITAEMQNELRSIEGILPENSRSRLCSVIKDSMNVNVAAKNTLSKSFDSVLFLPCHAHQLNLMAGNVLTHHSVKSIANSAKAIVNFFIVFPKQKLRLQNIMVERNEKALELVQEGDTRWYSHYSLVVSLFKARPFLEEFKQSVRDCDLILKKALPVEALDAIGSTSFWTKLGLVAELLRPLTMEIAGSERTNAGDWR
eukprot:IDg3158t1